MPSRFILNDFSGGISNENFYGSKGQVLFMENINIDERKYMKLEQSYVLTTNFGAFNESVSQIVETPNGLMQIGGTKIWLNSADKSGVVGGANRFEYLGDTTGSQVNIFLQSGNILKTDATVTTVTGTVAHAVNAQVTASVIVYGKVLFAKNNIVYQYDPATPTTAPTIAMDKFLSGSTIKYLYFYNDILVAVTSKFDDTIIYQCQYNQSTGAYAIYTTEVKKGITVLGAIGDSGSVYWVNRYTIFQYNGGKSYEVKDFGYDASGSRVSVTSPKFAFTNRMLLMADGANIYRYGSLLPGRNPYMTKYTAPYSVQALSGTYIHVLIGTSNALYSLGGYQSTSQCITLPYDAGIYGDEKSNLAFRASYQLPTITYSGTQCSITIGVMTDAMEVINNVNYVTVSPITDRTLRKTYISVNEINTALQTAGYSGDWQYIKFKIVLNGGNESSGVMARTPLFFDIKAIHNTINDGLED